MIGEKTKKWPLLTGVAAVIISGLFGWSLAYLGLRTAEEARWPMATTWPQLAGLSTARNVLTLPSAVGETKIAGEEIRADLDQMTIALIRDGETLFTYPILSIGRPGSPWETPVGRYAVLNKELNHFSSIGEVWMPHSLQFFGNFFIHGWPHYADGRPVGQGYSGGCIRLSNADAARVYDFAKIGTPVILTGIEFGDNRESGESRSEKTNRSFYHRSGEGSVPAVSAEAYLVADLETGEVILGRDESAVKPIASITKLMTAVISLETINQFQNTTISAEAIATNGDYGGLRFGEILPTGDLLYPLLLESSNDAAEALAEHLGRDRFIDLMNQKARALGLERTSFVDPSGIGDGNQSNATDLFLLLRYLYQSKRYVLELTRKVEEARPELDHYWRNNSPLVTQANYLGGKSGKTTAAKETLSAIFDLPLAEFERRPIAIILLRSQDRDQDVQTLLNYLRANVFFSQVLTDDAKVTLPTLTTLGFVGDMMFDRGVSQIVDEKGDGNFRFLFPSTLKWPTVDWLFGNLEGPLSDRGRDLGNLYSFRMKPALAPLLADLGFDVLSVANNHAGDWGREAFVDTLRRLKENNLAPIGGGETLAEATTLLVKEQRGQKIGWLAASDVGPAWLAADEQTSGIVLADNPDFLKLITDSSKAVDWLVVSLHWGEEYQTKPTSRQQTLARALIDAGADLVIGHHPHVVQPVERYRHGLIAYSLGNFIFDQSFSTETLRGQFLVVHLAGDNIVSWEARSSQQNNEFQLVSIK